MATKVRREMGYETAGASLGHTNMSATASYAERNQGLADEAAKRFGYNPKRIGNYELFIIIAPLSQ